VRVVSVNCRPFSASAMSMQRAGSRACHQGRAARLSQHHATIAQRLHGQRRSLPCAASGKHCLGVKYQHVPGRPIAPVVAQCMPPGVAPEEAGFVGRCSSVSLRQTHFAQRAAALGRLCRGETSCALVRHHQTHVPFLRRHRFDAKRLNLLLFSSVLEFFLSGDFGSLAWHSGRQTHASAVQ
jgi:hypothetical protein